MDLCPGADAFMVDKTTRTGAQRQAIKHFKRLGWMIAKDICPACCKKLTATQVMPVTQMPVTFAGRYALFMRLDATGSEIGGALNEIPGSVRFGNVKSRIAEAYAGRHTCGGDADKPAISDEVMQTLLARFGLRPVKTKTKRT